MERMNKWLALGALLLLLVACAKPAPTEIVQTPAPSTDAQVSTVASDISDVDSIDQDLDTSDIDSLDQDFATI